MATLCKLACFLSLSSHKLFLNHRHLQQQQECKLCWTKSENPPRKDFKICTCSAKKPRGGRKVKSNVELCNDIREFVSVVGLPEGHVPSFKELCDHGRNDLANIVRRRGYKVIRDLLSNTIKTDIDGSSEQKMFAEGHDAISDGAEMSAGQDEKVKVLVEDRSLLSEVPSNSNYSGSTGTEHHDEAKEVKVNSSSEEDSLYTVEQQDEVVTSLVEDRPLLIPSYDLTHQDGQVKDIVEGNCLITPNSVEQLHEEVLSEVNTFVSEASMELELQDKERGCIIEHNFCVEQQIEEVPSIVEDISFSSEASSTDDNNLDSIKSYADLNFEANNSMSKETSFSSFMEEEDLLDAKDSSRISSLEEKVANFIQNGDLDAVEDNVYGMADESGTEDIGADCEQETVAPVQTKTRSEENFEHTIGGSKWGSSVNGTFPTSVQAMPPVAVNDPIRNHHFPAESLASADHDKDFNTETGKRENQVEINHLKFMLHQKELELSRLKDLIEKEKRALSTLQSKAEEEISKAQKLISEKDAELLAAEESLSGLVEVKLQFSGDGEIVEVTGSFNGWHHRIKMDLQPSSVNIDPFGPRKSRIWSTMLWLYPGLYEIKFIVDGHWKIDPERETVTKGAICNNILRVSI